MASNQSLLANDCSFSDTLFQRHPGFVSCMTSLSQSELWFEQSNSYYCHESSDYWRVTGECLFSSIHKETHRHSRINQEHSNSMNFLLFTNVISKNSNPKNQRKNSHPKTTNSSNLGPRSQMAQTPRFAKKNSEQKPAKIDEEHPAFRDFKGAKDQCFSHLLVFLFAPRCPSTRTSTRPQPLRGSLGCDSPCPAGRPPSLPEDVVHLTMSQNPQSVALPWTSHVSL